MAADVTCGAVDPLSGAVCSMAAGHTDRQPRTISSHADHRDPQVLVWWSDRDLTQPPDPERRRCWRRRGVRADGQASVCDQRVESDSRVGLCRRCREEMEDGG